MPSINNVVRQLFLAYVSRGVGRFIGLLGGVVLVASFIQATFFPEIEIYNLTNVGWGLVVLYLMVGTWGLASTAAVASIEAERLQNSWDATGRFRLPLSQAVDKLMARLGLEETAAARKLESLLLEGHLQAWGRYELEEDGGDFADREEPISPTYWIKMQLVTPIVRSSNVAPKADVMPPDKGAEAGVGDAEIKSHALLEAIGMPVDGEHIGNGIGRIVPQVRYSAPETELTNLIDDGMTEREKTAHVNTYAYRGGDLPRIRQAWGEA